MAQYQSKKRPGVLYLEDGRSFAYNDPFEAPVGTAPYDGPGEFPPLSGSDLTHLQTGVIVLVAGDPGEPVKTVERLNVDPTTTEVWPAGSDPNTDDPIVALNSVVKGAVLDQDDLAQQGLKLQFVIETDEDGDPVTDSNGIILQDIRIVEA